MGKKAVGKLLLKLSGGSCDDVEDQLEHTAGKKLKHSEERDMLKQAIKEAASKEERQGAKDTLETCY